MGSFNSVLPTTFPTATEPENVPKTTGGSPVSGPRRESQETNKQNTPTKNVDEADAISKLRKAIGWDTEESTPQKTTPNSNTAPSAPVSRAASKTNVTATPEHRRSSSRVPLSRTPSKTNTNANEQQKNITASERSATRKRDEYEKVSPKSQFIQPTDNAAQPLNVKQSNAPSDDGLGRGLVDPHDEVYTTMHIVPKDIFSSKPNKHE